MPDGGVLSDSRVRGLRLAFLVALIVTAGTNLVSYLVSQLLFRSLYASGPPLDFGVTQLYNLLSSLTRFVLNPVALFLIFYRSSSRFRFQSNSDYFDLLKYLFAGGFLGALLGFGGGLGFAYWFYGAGFQISDVSYNLNLFVLGPASEGLGTMFISFTAIVVGHLRSSDLFAAGASQEPANQTESPQQPE